MLTGAWKLRAIGTLVALHFADISVPIAATEVRRMSHLLQDLKYAIRSLTKQPGLTFVAIATLALGIGANTAIFSLADQVLLRLLPVQHPEQLVVLSSTEGRNGSVTSDYGMDAAFSYPMYKEVRNRNEVFSGLLACFAVEANVSWRGHADHGTGELVSGNFF
jgi:putative ABC transport system permease protein